MKFEGFEHQFNFHGAQVLKTSKYNKLSLDEKSVLEPQLVEVASKAFKREVDEAFRQDVVAHLNGGELYMAIVGGRAEAFAVMEVFPDMKTLYISGVVKTAKAPSRVIQAIAERSFKDNKSEVVTVRTQNDRVIDVKAKKCRTVVALDREADIAEHHLLERMGLLYPQTMSDKDLASLIVSGHYGGTMIGEGKRYRSPNNKVRALTERINYYDGDALLLVGL